MKVTEMNTEQINFLKRELFYGEELQDIQEDLYDQGIRSWQEIPDAFVRKSYKFVDFDPEELAACMKEEADRAVRFPATEEKKVDYVKAYADLYGKEYSSGQEQDHSSDPIR